MIHDTECCGMCYCGEGCCYADVVCDGDHRCCAHMGVDPVIERNDLWVSIGVVPHRFADDESYKIWQDPDRRHQYLWHWDSFGAWRAVKGEGNDEEGNREGDQ